MENILIYANIIAPLFIVLLLMPFWIKKAKQIGLVWEDMNKLKSDKVAGSGGIIVTLAFVLGILIFIGYRVFVVKTNEYLVETFAILNVVLLSAGIGLIDDLLGWRQGGLSRRSRIILLFVASIPLMAINAGQSAINIPILGNVSFGILYPLLIIPIGIIGATTTFNFLAGFNSLEAGQGIIILSGLSIVAFLTGNSWLAIVGIVMISSLIGFLKFNRFPARVFPGDVLTYPIGTLIAAMARVGNFEKIAMFFFIPWIFEFFLKSRGKLIKHSFGKPTKEGTLELKYPKIYGLTHLTIYIMNKFGVKATEKRVVYAIWTFQAIIIISGFLIFREGIFLHGY